MASVTYLLGPSSSAAKFIRLSFLLLDLDFFSPPSRLMTQPVFCLLTQTTLFHRRPFRINFLCSLYSTTHDIPSPIYKNLPAFLLHELCNFPLLPPVETTDKRIASHAETEHKLQHFIIIMPALFSLSIPRFPL
jgi:hypothetical protein